LDWANRESQGESLGERREREKRLRPPKENGFLGVALGANDKTDGFTAHKGDYIRDSYSSSASHLPLPPKGDNLLMMFNP